MLTSRVELLLPSGKVKVNVGLSAAWDAYESLPHIDRKKIMARLSVRKEKHLTLTVVEQYLLKRQITRWRRKYKSRFIALDDKP